MFYKYFAFVVLVAGVRSQNSATYTLNHDGTTNLGAKIPIYGNDHNVLSALGSKSSTGAVGKGLAFDNVNGHGLSLTHTNIPAFGSQLTGAGRLNLVNNANHRLDAGAFITQNRPSIPNVPNFNTAGGSLDYMFKNKVGASVGVAQTPFLQRTDYSAIGNLNLHRSPTSSIDLNAGATRSVSPFIKSRWQPTGGLSFTKFWRR